MDRLNEAAKDLSQIQPNIKIETISCDLGQPHGGETLFQELGDVSENIQFIYHRKKKHPGFYPGK